MSNDALTGNLFQAPEGVEANLSGARSQSAWLCAHQAETGLAAHWITTVGAK